ESREVRAVKALVVFLAACWRRDRGLRRRRSAAALELFELRSHARHRLLHRRDRFLAVFFDFRQTLHDRADGFRDALTSALLAVEHTLAQFASENVLPLVEAFSHARDLLAHMLNRLRAALLNCADALFEALREAPDLKAHAIKG